MDIEAKIILAEDNAGHAALIKKNLARSGIKNAITTFNNGRSLLDHLFKLKQDFCKHKNISLLLFLDIRLPRVNGIDVLKKIKQDAVLKDVNVIIVTTTDDPREIRKCYSLGCNAYITKPLAYDKFRKTFSDLGIYLNFLQLPILCEKN